MPLKPTALTAADSMRGGGPWRDVEFAGDAMPLAAGDAMPLRDEGGVRLPRGDDGHGGPALL